MSFIFPTSCREVAFENSVQLGQNYFLPVDISLENVLTGKENFFATVDFSFSAVPNIVRGLFNLDGIVHYLHNNGTAVRHYITTE